MANQPVVVVYRAPSGQDVIYSTAYSPDQVEDVTLDAAARGYTGLRVMPASTPTNLPHMRQKP